MKKIFLLAVIFLLVSSHLFADVVIWEETFSPDPGTWTLDSHWSIQSGALQLTYSPPTSPFDFSAFSPPINLPETVKDLTISQFIDEYPGNNGEVASIELIHEGGTTELWNFPMEGTNWGSPGGTDISFSLTPYAGQEVELRFRCYGGSTFNYEYWYIYNIMIDAFNIEHDLAATNISGDTFLNVGEQGSWDITVKNNGLNTESGFEVKLMREPGITLAIVEPSSPLAPNGQETYRLNWTPDIDEIVDLYGEVELINDDVIDNNDTDLFSVHIYPEDPLDVLVWNDENPSTTEEYNPEVYIENALAANNVIYDTYTSLPVDLSLYDAIFVTLGTWTGVDG